jgi:phosphomannomutase
MELFGTAGIRGDVRTDVTPAHAVAVGRAVARAAVEEASATPRTATVVVGRDGRTTGAALAAAVEAGALSGGASVRRLGVVPTPALAFASLGRHGVMLTASHNPPGDNGIKCFVDGVEYDHDREATVERRVDADAPPADWDAWGDAREAAVLDAYRAAVVDYARGYGAPLDGLPVVVDCGNGTGALATPAVLRELGASVEVLEGNVDGHFPGRESKPTRESLEPFRTFLEEGPYDIGMAHDGDADRIVVLDGDGTVVHEDTILADIAERYVDDCEATDPVVVTTPNASGRIDERVEAAGGRTTRVALGSLADGIAAVRNEGGTVAFAAEPWKHVHPGFGDWIDGVAGAAIVARLVAEAGSIDALTSSITERPYRKEAVGCPEGEKARAMERVASELPRRFPEASLDPEHGVRLDLPGGSWLLVRPSGTEPLIRIYAESDDVESLLETARTVVEAAVREE